MLRACAARTTHNCAGRLSCAFQNSCGARWNYSDELMKLSSLARCGGRSAYFPKDAAASLRKATVVPEERLELSRSHQNWRFGYQFVPKAKLRCHGSIAQGPESGKMGQMCDKMCDAVCLLVEALARSTGFPNAHNLSKQLPDCYSYPSRGYSSIALT